MGGAMDGISSIWNRIQRSLFPFLEEELGELTEYHRKLAATVERVLSRLKDEFGGRMIRVRGAVKVMAHLMFGILALTADQLLRMIV